VQREALERTLAAAAETAQKALVTLAQLPQWRQQAEGQALVVVAGERSDGPPPVVSDEHLRK
jgi:uncharacterized protein YndB with AHSA1/START domain